MAETARLERKVRAMGRTNVSRSARARMRLLLHYGACRDWRARHAARVQRWQEGSSCHSPASHGAGGGGFYSGDFAGCLLVRAFGLLLSCTP